MCRLFGLLGNASSPAEPWLVASDRSLLAQSNASDDQLQSDGWGVAWADPKSGTRIEKGVGGAFEPGEIDRFRSASHRAHGPVVVAHLRKASNPLNLPRERLIALENCQPFAHGGYLFAHNGMLNHPREVRPLLGEFESKVRGVNDSEVLFWLLMHHLGDGGDPLSAYVAAVRTLHDVWMEKGSPKTGPFSGLNVVLARTPGEMWAFCLSRGEHGSGLLDRSRPYYEMAYRSDAKELLVGSEPFDSSRSGWKSLPNGSFLHARSAHGLVAVDVGMIPIPAELRPSPPAKLEPPA